MVFYVKTSELVARRELIHRRVGVVVPRGQSAVGIAIDLYRNLGIDVEIADHEIFVMVGEALALHVQWALERRTGIPAFNEWSQGTSSVPG